LHVARESPEELKSHAESALNTLPGIYSMCHVSDALATGVQEQWQAWHFHKLPHITARLLETGRLIEINISKH
jgi:hypothetical protein